MFDYEVWTELVHFKVCELNVELVHVESELSQHRKPSQTVGEEGGVVRLRSQQEVQQFAVKASFTGFQSVWTLAACSAVLCRFTAEL